MSKKTAAVQQLESESARFTALAKDIALNLLVRGESVAEGTTEWMKLQESKAKAHDHLIRAETFKDAARIAAGHKV